jgi:hypothetical protein
MLAVRTVNVGTCARGLIAVLFAFRTDMPLHICQTSALSAAEVAVNVATKRKRAWLPAASLTLAAGAQSYVFVVSCCASMYFSLLAIYTLFAVPYSCMLSTLSVATLCAS